MTTITRSNPKGLEILTNALKELDGKVGRAGWFETAKYEDGTPVATIAIVNEFGATIQHPGGTPYRIKPDGRAEFVSKANGAGLPVTKPHQIVIPPRPFMRPTVARERNNWMMQMAAGARQVFKGTMTAYQVMEAVAKLAAGNIQETISALQDPPLKPSTIAARRRAKSNKKLVGSLTKPLVAEGILFKTVIGKAEDG